MSNMGMRKIVTKSNLLIIVLIAIATGCSNKMNYNKYVDRFTGTGGNGGIVPVASMPFGMVQLGPDTRMSNTGYHYNDQTLLGFSHVHKSGAGCSDFQDILFLPLPANTTVNNIIELKRKQFTAPLIHEAELAEPGYYQVKLYEDQLKVELASSLRCGFQRYTYQGEGEKSLVIDLEHGSDCGCSIVKEQNVDTIIVSSFELVDNNTVRGMRVSGGFAPEQHVYFHTTFSQPIKKCVLFVNNHRIENITSAKGKNIKALLIFGGTPNIIEIKTGISPVDLEGARKNLREDALKTFDEIRKDAHDQWNKVLGMIKIDCKNEKKSRLFYTAMFNLMMYPTLYSDVDNRFRGPDRTIHKTDGYRYYGGVMGLWDTFRAACPLQSVLEPKVMEDYVRTCLDHFKYAGQLPIWTLASVETYQMIGLPAMPFITNAYLNGINGFNTNYAMEAMRVSAMKDTCGYSMNYFVGLKNYKTYGYVPCDLEMESVARTLEYAYADHAIAEFAKATSHQKDYDYFSKRSLNYKNVIQPSTGFARGKTSDGKWREPFDPLLSEHRRDDYCEGNAWQWSFFVPHDVAGLANYLGGKSNMLARMDSLFTMKSAVSGNRASDDISGLIGQYAHGNEPSHHIVYMYNELGEPKKTQRYVNQILTTLYDTTPEGICGNDDTGQMSAWYIFSSLGFYPMDPVSGKYQLGAPLFEDATIHLPLGKAFIIKANNLSESNIYVKKVSLNGNKLDRNYITFKELLNGGELVFEMTDANNN